MARSITFIIEGEVNTRVTVTEQDGKLIFDVSVLGTGSIGDLRALFFNVDENLVDPNSLSVEGDATITDSLIDANNVDTLGQDANIKGEIVNGMGDFDVGVEFGTKGLTDDIQDASFTLSSDDPLNNPLTLEMISDQHFGVRITSVGDIGGDRTSSVKLDDQSSAAITANDDSFVVDEGTIGDDDVLDDDSMTTGLMVTKATVNGDELVFDVFNPVTTAGGRAGSLSISADGSISFDAMDPSFDNLAVGDEDFVVVTYQSVNADGSTAWATHTVTVTGVNDPATVSSAVVLLQETDLRLSTGGTLTSSDVDNPDNTFTPSMTEGAIGTFAIDAMGAWTFNANSAFDSLNVGDNVNETYNVTSVDGTPSTVEVTIAGTNDPPVLDLDLSEVSTTGFAPIFTEGGGPVAITDTDVSITDVDDTNIEFATITLTNAPDGPFEGLIVGPLPFPIVPVVSPDSTQIVLTGSASLADYQTALAQIHYDNASQNPNQDTRIVEITVNDGDANSNTAISTVEVIGVPDPAPGVTIIFDGGGGLIPDLFGLFYVEQGFRFHQSHNPAPIQIDDWSLTGDLELKLNDTGGNTETVSIARALGGTFSLDQLTIEKPGGFGFTTFTTFDASATMLGSHMVFFEHGPQVVNFNTDPDDPSAFDNVSFVEWTVDVGSVVIDDVMLA